MKNRLLILFLCLLLPSLLSAKPLVVDVRHRPPEMVLDEGSLSGPIKSIIERMIVGTDLEVSWQNVPWPRTLSRAIKGDVDLIPRHSLTKERQVYMLPMLLGFEQRSVKYLLSPKYKTVERFTHFNDFHYLNFGMLRGSYYSDKLDKLMDSGNVIYANSIEQLMELLLIGRIDVVPIQNIAWAEAAYKKYEGIYPKYNVAPFSENFLSGKYISMSKKSPFVRDYHKLNCALYTMRLLGVVDNIYLEYGVTTYVQSFEHPESMQQKTSCVM